MIEVIVEPLNALAPILVILYEMSDISIDDGIVTAGYVVELIPLTAAITLTGL
jgi:hypothetical protein